MELVKRIGPNDLTGNLQRPLGLSVLYFDTGAFWLWKPKFPFQCMFLIKLFIVYLLNFTKEALFFELFYKRVCDNKGPCDIYIALARYVNIRRHFQMVFTYWEGVAWYVPFGSQQRSSSSPPPTLSVGFPGGQGLCLLSSLRKMWRKKRQCDGFRTSRLLDIDPQWSMVFNQHIIMCNKIHLLYSIIHFYRIHTYATITITR